MARGDDFVGATAGLVRAAGLGAVLVAAFAFVTGIGAGARIATF